MEIKISRQIDELGRLIIPADFREQYGLNPGKIVSFIKRKDGILIRLEDSNNRNDNSEE